MLSCHYVWWLRETFILFSGNKKLSASNLHGPDIHRGYLPSHSQRLLHRSNVNSHPLKHNTYSPAARRIIDPRYPAEHHYRTLPNQPAPSPSYQNTVGMVPIKDSSLHTATTSSHYNNPNNNHVASTTSSSIGGHGNQDSKYHYDSKLQGSHKLHSADEGGYNVKSQTYFNPRQQELTATMVTLSDGEHGEAYVSNDVMVWWPTCIELYLDDVTKCKWCHDAAFCVKIFALCEYSTCKVLWNVIQT